MKTLCANCNSELETKTNKTRLCNFCRKRASTLFYKLAAIYYKGSKCEKCGWSGNHLGFDFHHIDPNEKEFEMNTLFQKRKSWNNIKKELDKCQLLCTSCHRLNHSSQLSDVPFLAFLDIATKIDFYKDWIDEKILEKLNNEIKNKKCRKPYITDTYICQNNKCQKMFTKTHSANAIVKYCSAKCRDLNNGQLEIPPTKEELEEMHQNMSWDKIANHFGITRRSIYKWRKKYNIE